MPYVRSNAAYQDFIKGRDVDSALHYEPCCVGPCIGIVEVLRDTDEVIDKATYDTEAVVIKQHNLDHYVAPVVPTPVPTANELLAAEMAGLTAAISDLKASFTTNLGAAAAAEKMAAHTDKMKLILEQG